METPDRKTTTIAKKKLYQSKSDAKITEWTWDTLSEELENLSI